MSIEELCHRYKVDSNGCWIYQGSKNKDGYGVMYTQQNGKKSERAHRVAWEFWNEKKIPEGMTVDHICFVRDCINPEHLRLLPPNENRGRHHNGNGRQLSMWCDKHQCKKKAVNWSGGKIKAYCPVCHKEKHAKWYKERGRELYLLKKINVCSHYN